MCHIAVDESTGTMVKAFWVRREGPDHHYAKHFIIVYQEPGPGPVDQHTVLATSSLIASYPCV